MAGKGEGPTIGIDLGTDDLMVQCEGCKDWVMYQNVNSNSEMKRLPLAKELGIKVVPTFKILKDKKVVKEVTGAKFEDLVHAIDTND
uniref:Thioredoxin domain-containing protein n=1 Tax=Cucumis melo TaxID=3656 RepID=A0A9I9EJ25_CUCME